MCGNCGTDCCQVSQAPMPVAPVQEELCNCGRTPTECAEWPDDCVLEQSADYRVDVTVCDCEDGCDICDPCDCPWCQSDGGLESTAEFELDFDAYVVSELERFGVKEAFESKLISLSQDRDRVLSAIHVLQTRRAETPGSQARRILFGEFEEPTAAEEELGDLMTDIEGEIADVVRDWAAL